MLETDTLFRVDGQVALVTGGMGRLGSQYVRTLAVTGYPRTVGPGWLGMGLEPSGAIAEFGSGDTVTCTGPGTPYDTNRPSSEQHTDCSYTYRHSSAGQPGEHYVVTATVEWAATWTVTGAPGGGNLGIVRRSSSVSIRVAEAEALNE